MPSRKSEHRQTAWQVKRQASYDTLVGSAMDRFHTHGYTATRVEDIVAGTGYTSGAFYFHFKNKADCFWHVVAYRQQQRQGWDAFLDGLDPDTADLDAVVRRALSELNPAGERSGWTLVMAEHFQAHRDDPEVATRFAELFRGWHRNQTAFVRLLQQRGWVDPSRDPAQIALQLLSFVEGLAVHSLVFGINTDAIQAAQIDGAVNILAGIPAHPAQP